MELASAAREEEPPPAPTGGPSSPVEKAFVAQIEDVAAVAPPVISDNAGVRRRRVAAKIIRPRDKDHASSWPHSPALSAVGRHPKRIIRFAQPRALGRKVSDEYTVPICRVHHRDLHGYGDEASWWAGIGIDPLLIALELWRRSKTYTLAATLSGPLSDAIPPPAAKVQQAPLDGEARDQIDVAEVPDRPPP